MAERAPTVTAIPAFSDNYIWAVHRPGVADCLLVDPGDAGPALAWCEAHGHRPAALLITHHHGDHVGGIAALAARFPGLAVYGPRGERIAGLTTRVGEGERLAFPALGLTLRVLDVPGHTHGHVAYLGEEGSLFCGDTLFSVGCGRVFSGTFEQLFHSLARLRELPGETRVYCAHEYTLDNIGFAKWVEPDNADLRAREAEAHACLDADRPTLPSTLAGERRCNPFLRWDVPAVRAAAERWAGRPLETPLAVFTALRQWKDRDYD